MRWRQISFYEMVALGMGELKNQTNSSSIWHLATVWCGMICQTPCIVFLQDKCNNSWKMESTVGILCFSMKFRYTDSVWQGN
jgi:hypothetical protein